MKGLYHLHFLESIHACSRSSVPYSVVIFTVVLAILTDMVEILMQDIQMVLG